jgi:CTP synthase (UTP-ammonia lyase)
MRHLREDERHTIRERAHRAEVGAYAHISDQSDITHEHRLAPTPCSSTASHARASMLPPPSYGMKTRSGVARASTFVGHRNRPLVSLCAGISRAPTLRILALDAFEAQTASCTHQHLVARKPVCQERKSVQQQAQNRPMRYFIDRVTFLRHNSNELCYTYRCPVGTSVSRCVRLAVTVPLV